jgi:amino acid transporter
MGLADSSADAYNPQPRTLGIGAAMGETLALGPIFSAGFLSGTVAAFAGFNAPLSVLIAAVGAIALADVLAVYGRRFAGAGAVYEYLVRGAHPAVGIIGAGSYAIGLLFLGAGGGFAGQGYLMNNLLAGQLNVTLGWWF